MGTDAGKLLGFLSEIVLFNSFMRDYLMKEKYLKELTNTNITLLQDSHLLDLILNIIAIVGKIVSFINLANLCYKYFLF